MASVQQELSKILLARLNFAECCKHIIERKIPKKDCTIKKSSLCACALAYLQQQQVHSKLAQEEESKIIGEIETALERACSIRCEYDKPPPKKAVPKLAETIAPARSQNKMKQQNAHCMKSQVSPCEKKKRNIGRPLKPVYMNAPYQTQFIKPKQRKTGKNSEKLEEKTNIHTSDDTCKDAVDKSVVAGDVCTRDKAIVPKPLQVESRLPDLSNFRCTCVENDKAQKIALLASVERRLRDTLTTYGHTCGVFSADQFIRYLHQKNEEQNRYCHLGITILGYFERLFRLLDDFSASLSFTEFDNLDPSTRDWFISLFYRLVHINSVLQIGRQSLPITQCPSRTDQVELMDDDPLGAWLDSVKPSIPSNSNEIPSHPLFAHLTSGCVPKGMPSRLYGFTVAPGLVTLEGTKDQVREFLDLWEMVEREQFVGQTLSILERSLPLLLQNMEELNPRSASAFRELYGFICSFYPVALKESFTT